ncbi:hypothetical protein GYA54_01780, partial [Candidatus Kuenenbacteria bacterium]|nr:hypothetical protein [Candidatus Kuenenbacteria bacterium]
MGDEYGVIPGDYVSQVENEGNFTKETAQAEWFEKFGIRDTRDWRQLLEIDPAKAKEALQHVVDNREHFPQYDD